ncbi:MAG TPA: ATP-binding protein [Burkholderiaceae bacterium]
MTSTSNGDPVTDSEVRQALEEVVDTAMAITGAGFGNVQLLDPATGDLRIVAQRGFPAWWLEYWNAVAKGHGACGTALARRERVVVEDVERSPIFVGTPGLDIQRRAGVRAVQSTPVFSRAGAPLGMFSTHFRAVHQPDGQAQKLLDLLARHVGELVERFRAEDEIRKLNAELRLRVTELEEARSRAEQLAHSKSAFLANMSHEIRTPMNAILGMAHLMRKDGLTPMQSGRVDHIATAAEHLVHLVGDILDMSKIEAGKLRLEQSPFMLDEVLARVVAMVAPRAAEKGLELRSDAPPLPHALVGDAMRLTQALLNYVNNAVKFTDQGSVTLRSRPVQKTPERTLIRFEVEDSGIGIAPDQLRRLFNAFEQADDSTTRKYGGTGLGLAITRRLARLMEGDAGVSSVPDVGSVFWFTAWFANGDALPAAGAGAADGEPPDVVLAREHAGRRVLLVEDDPVNQLITSEMVSGMGLVVDKAGNGLEAVSQAQARPYDLILMDVQMPHLDGMEATRSIRALPGFASVPIIALTAGGIAEVRDKCRAAGLDDLLSKPTPPRTLAAVLLKWLSR